MSDNIYPKFIEGERVYLRALEESDANGRYHFWLNDEEVCRGNSHYIYPHSKKQTINYILQAPQAHTSLVLAIVLHENDLHIGNIALQQINWISRTAEFAILLGEKEQWGKGYGLEAARLIIRHGFSVMNLNRIACGTFENNQGMQKLALALGMQQEGVRRQAVYKKDKYLNIIEYGLLNKEFNGSSIE